MKANRTKKGFTLMELIIVIAIMGILIAILVPAWGYFMRRAHERSANAKAKVVFNAAQTEATRMSIRERTYVNTFNTSSNASEKEAANRNIYMGDGDFYYYWDGNSGSIVNASGGNVLNSVSDNAKKTFMQRADAKFTVALNGITKGEGVYKIYIHNYNVQSVFYTDMATSNYKGAYPVNLDMLEDSGVDVDPIRSADVSSVDMDNFVLPASSPAATSPT